MMKRNAEKYKRVRMVKAKPKVLQHFKVDPVLIIDETFFKQGESMFSIYEWLCSGMTELHRYRTIKSFF